jgi:alkylhydroperoxidase family enzyme
MIMARIKPLTANEISPSVKEAFERHVKEYGGRITNMKSTLGHSLPAFEAYMEWYPLYTEVEKILGARMASLYAHSISCGADCPLCSTFFRKIIIDAGETPEKLELTEEEKNILDFGSSIAKHKGNIADYLYNTVAVNYNEKQMVILVAFAGIMIATNIFNNVIETEIDDYLSAYKSTMKYC